MWIHILSGFIIMMLTLIYSFLALQSLAWLVFIGWHEIMGLAHIGLVILLNT